MLNLVRFASSGGTSAEADKVRESRDWVLAAELYRAVMDYQPHQPDILVQYGHGLKESGDVDGALHAYPTNEPMPIRFMSVAWDCRASICGMELEFPPQSDALMGTWSPVRSDGFGSMSVYRMITASLL